MLSIRTTDLRNKKLPWWTWIIPLPIFFIGTLISLEAKITTGTSLFYFPLPFALALVYWWGPRVLPTFYLNAVGCAGLWGLERVAMWPIYGLPEVIFVFLSWLLFSRILAGKIWLPNTEQVVYFLIAGILIPLVVYKFILEAVFVAAGDAPVDHYWNLVVTTGFGDFISAFCVSIPLLHFLTKFMVRKGLFFCDQEVEPGYVSGQSKSRWLELGAVALVAYSINNYLSFTDYWFLNGILSLYVAMRFGFGATVLMNSYILVITYVIPAALHNGFSPNHFLESSMLKTQLGTTLLYVFTIITGRLVSDMRQTEFHLNERYKELNHINSELDQFVYSVSHDLSAPLKSILGLVNVSRMTSQENELRQQIDLIEKSVYKLEAFIAEVLDYSRSKRREVIDEEINLRELSQEVFDSLKFTDGFDEIQINLDAMNQEVLVGDRSRLKIILLNLFSNAIRFRRKDQKSYIRVSTQSNDGKLTLLVEDNGEGIKPEFQSKIFNMFFKGTERSAGSGLGLYIAVEAAKKINARISVESTYGSGSTFSIVFE